MSDEGLPPVNKHSGELELGLKTSLPNPGFSTEEFNREFYGGYPRFFFDHGLMAALALLKDPAGTLGPITSETTIHFGEGENVLRISVGDLDSNEEDEYRTFAKLPD